MPPRPRRRLRRSGHLLRGPEIELAFGTLFGTFGPAFFRRYGELRPLRPGFFEVRRDLYNLYPLLVHVRLFGGGYVGQVEAILSRLS